MAAPQPIRPGDPGYSAQRAIAKALQSLVEIRGALAHARSRAEAAHKSSVADASARQRVATQAAVDADRKLQADAVALNSELDEAARDAAGALRRANLSLRAAHKPGGARSGGTGDVNQTVHEINAGLADLQNALEEHARVRMTIIARIRRNVGLPP